MGVDFGSHSFIELLNVELRFKKLLRLLFVDLHVFLVLALQLYIHLIEFLAKLIHGDSVSQLLVDLCDYD